jgi:hypothetical protein
LFDTPDDQTLTTTTGSDGSYGFPNVNPGNYRVTIDTATLPNAATTPTFNPDGTGTPHVAEFNLPAGSTVDTIDFGYRGTASLGDRVWYDADNDGIQDANEPGLAGVTVTLVWAGPDNNFDLATDNLTLTTTTGADGSYSFANLPSGNYRVSVTPATLPNGITTPTSDLDGIGTAHTADTTLTAGQARIDADFGYRGTGSLGDLVWFNPNANATQDAGEPGLGGVTVDLVWAGPDNDFNTTTDNLTLTTSTSSTAGTIGQYLFQNLAGGSYQVTVNNGTIPNGANVPNFDLDGVGTANTVATTLTVGQARTDVDFGYEGTFQIRHRLWYDINGDGIQDAGEPGLVGVSLTAVWAGPNGILGDGDDATLTTTTGADGVYLIDGLPQGLYRVTVNTATIPFGITAPTSDVDGTPDGVGNFTLSANRTDVDFGFTGTSSLAGNVYNDADNNGQRGASEGGIGGVTLTLAGTDVSGQVINRTTTTAADGTYLFPFLLQGTYTITETQPTGYFDGLDASGTPPGTVTNDQISAIALPAGTTGTGHNFGELAITRLVGSVYLDLNNNGMRDADERGITNVRITLKGTNDLGQLIKLTVLTGSDGSYLFDNLRPGTYTITETHPNPFADGKDTRGSAGGTVKNDQIQNIVLGVGQTAVDYLFGERGLRAGYVNKQFVLNNEMDIAALNLLFERRNEPYRVGTVQTRG